MSNDLKTDRQKDIVDIVKDIVDDVVDDVVDDLVKLEENKIRKRFDEFLNKNKSEIIDNYLSYTKIGVGIGFGVFTSIMLSRYFYNKF